MRKKRPAKTLTATTPDYVAVPLQDAAPIMGIKVETLRKKCVSGGIPAAFKTSVTKGDWRIPFAFLRPFVNQKSA